MSTISVIIPAYNAERYIGETMASVRAQKRPADETIVVDDGSRDRTSAVVAAESWVRLITQPNAGESVARNTGGRASSGEYVVFLDADDILAPGMIATAAEVLDSEPDIGVVHGDKTTFGVGQTESSPGGLSESGPDALAAIVRGGVLNPGQYMLRRKVFETVGGFNVARQFGEDWEFLLRLARACRFKSGNSVFLRKRVHGAMQSLRSDTPDICAQRCAILEAVFGEEYGEIAKRYLGREVLADWLRSFGFDCAMSGDMRRAERYLWRSLLKAPLQPALLLWLAANQMRKVRAGWKGRLNEER